MRTTTSLIALLAALASGLAIGTQVTFTDAAGRLIGPLRAALLINLCGGALGGLILLALRIAGQPIGDAQTIRAALRFAALVGLMGIGILTGIAYALPRTGLAAGLGAIFLGQMVIAMTVDTLGRAGIEPIPLDLRRVAGLVLMGLAAALLLPRGG